MVYSMYTIDLLAPQPNLLIKLITNCPASDADLEVFEASVAALFDISKHHTHIHIFDFRVPQSPAAKLTINHGKKK